ncbi:SusD/RagB family nutrient-binding outer membrane lipoprotein [Dyadobacter sp. 32]|uniref:SusD/RagB family nutrient-binding outer membrane lipoprotein n=1 Tax=Dyadobacter sp. 32 TaxID=538966 RepID=UPI0011ED98F4
MTFRSKINFLSAGLMVSAMLMVAGCQDLTEINKNPNSLTDDKVNPAYVLTSVITGSASELADLSFSGNITQRVVPEAMQYTQRDFLEFSVTNQFGWLSLPFDYRGLYLPLANASYLERRAAGNQDSLFLKGTAKVMQALWYGVETSAWGDIPYSEAQKGTGNLQPAFDKQIDIFTGIIKSLDEANGALTRAVSVKSAVVSGADLLYGGNVLKWRQFANSLRLRYLMRLSAKTEAMKAVGLDVPAEFKKMVSDPTTYPLITSSAHDAALRFPGTNTTDSWTMGPLITTTLSEFYRTKAASTIVDFLKERNDPRLTIWFRPVEVQTLVRDRGADVVIAKDAAGMVKRYMKTYQAGVDTSLYVGLKIALSDPDSYNSNNAAHRTQAVALNSAIYNSGAGNPFVSYLGTIYRTNTDPLVKSIFISAAEVNFTLAEAASRGWITGSASDFMLAGVSASLDQYAIANGDVKVYNPTTHAIVAFNKTAFLDKIKGEYEVATDKLEVIMQQKWAAAFTTMEAWFDYRRTGYPKIGKNIINGGKGDQIPIRYIYGESETNYNTENTNAAISRLSPATNDQWAKMWLLQ